MLTFLSFMSKKYINKTATDENIFIQNAFY